MSLEALGSLDLAKNAPGAGLKDYEGQIDMVALRAYRLGRVREQLRARDYAGIVLYDPINIRYATGTRQMAVWTLHNAARYVFVPTEGPIILWEYNNPGAIMVSAGLETVDEVRPARTWFYFPAAEQAASRARAWGDELATEIRRLSGDNRRVAFDHLDPYGHNVMQELGFEVMDGQQVMERARVIKGPEEMACMNVCMDVCDAGMYRMREALKPGMTENALWSILHQTNIEMGGEWIETRLLTTGGRTNPWFQECGERVIRPGDLVSFDTDLIGPFGYCADVSRTFFCGPGKPSDEQKKLYGLAVDQIAHNCALLKPGVTHREICEKSWKIPNEYAANRYSLLHGVGLCDEYPSIPNVQDIWRLADPEGIVEPGMTLCVESYVGAEGGAEGVKLEQQVLITDNGLEILSTFPYEDAFLS
ncbi:MAG: Xaa-Pro peptidase family protein [Alphaproteobacteria bacterium]